MKVTKQVILFQVIYTIMVLVLFYLLTNKNNSTDVIPHRDALILDSLNNRIIQLQQLQDTKDSVIRAYEYDVAVLDSRIDSTNKQVNKTRKEYENKINNLSGASSNELTEFFTNRYQ